MHAVMTDHLWCSRCPATRFASRGELDQHEREHERHEREQRWRALLVAASADLEKMAQGAEAHVRDWDLDTPEDRADAHAALLAIEKGVVPPTINLDEPDPACDLDYCANEARLRRIDVALSNSFAFGGLNAVLAFKRV